MMEGFRLCRALWSGESVTWDGRWTVTDSVLAPVPYRPGGPPIWLAAAVPEGIDRAARHYDGWFPIGPDAETFGARRTRFVEAAEAAGRDPKEQTTALYLTVAVTRDAEEVEAAIDAYLEGYYGAPAKVMRRVQACTGGTLDEVLRFIRSYVEAGAEHVVLRIVGDHDRTLQALAAHRDEMAG